MTSIKDQIAILKDTKSELKKALEYKGVADVGDNLTEYAQKFSSTMPTMSLGGNTVQTPQTYGYTLNLTLDFQKIQQDIWNKATEAGKLAKEQFESNQVVNFVGNQDLFWAPKLDNLKDQTNLGMLYESCSNLTTLCPSQEWPETASMNLTFAGCNNLSEVNIPIIKITSGIETFANCSYLTTLPGLDYSECTSLNKHARSAKGSVDDPIMVTLNTSELCTDFNYAFASTSGFLIEVTGKVKPVGESRSTFAKCILLSGSLANIDLSEGTDLSNFFNSTTFLDTEATFSIPKTTTISSIFTNCRGNLTSLTLNDLQGNFSVESIADKLDNLVSISLNGDFSAITLAFSLNFKNVAQGPLVNLSGFQKCKVNLPYLYFFPNLSNESVQNLITNVYDFTAAGETPTDNQGKMTFHTDVYAQITEDQKAQATAKGWTILQSS